MGELDAKIVCDAIRWCIKEAGDAQAVAVSRDILEAAMDLIEGDDQ